MEIEDLDQNHSNQFNHLQPKNSMLSLTTLLAQALNNKDLNLIKFIIHNEQHEIIQNTLTNFKNQKLYLKFLQVIFDLLESFPQECKYALKWLKAFLNINKQNLDTEQKKLLKNKKEFLLLKTSMLKSLQNIDTKQKILQKISEENQQLLQKDSFGEPLVFIDETKFQVKNTFIDQYEKQQNNEQKTFFHIPKNQDFEQEEEDLMYENLNKSQDLNEKQAMYFDEDQNTEEEDQNEQDEEYL